MASKKQLKRAITDARKAKNSADRAIKELADIQVPRQARKAKRSLRKKLARFVARMARRIPTLRKRLAAKRKDGAKKAVAWATKQVGTTESPAGSNRGPFPISACQEFTLGFDGVAWCGCLIAYAAAKIGKAAISVISRLAYCPYIVEDARAGRNGLREVPIEDCQPGDFVVFDFGGSPAAHVGLCVARPSNGQVHCVEGNTSPGTSGSQDNGGGIFWRSRPYSHVACVARPDYS